MDVDTKKPVYVPVPDAFVAKFGKRITCEGYRGYGIFGDYDIFELVAESTNPTHFHEMK